MLSAVLLRTAIWRVVVNMAVQTPFRTTWHRSNSYCKSVTLLQKIVALKSFEFVLATVTNKHTWRSQPLFNTFYHVTTPQTLHHYYTSNNACRINSAPCRLSQNLCDSVWSSMAAAWWWPNTAETRCRKKISVIYNNLRVAMVLEWTVTVPV